MAPGRIAGFPRIGLRLYVESVSPGHRRAFVDLGPATVGRRYRVRVVQFRRDVWRAAIDGRAVGAATELPTHRGSWRGIATAETWTAPRAGCNAYRFRFGRVSVLASTGWTPLARGERVGASVAGDSSRFTASA